MTVLKYISKRFLMMIPTLLGVILILNIILTLAPGDPARLILGNDATVEQLEEFREEHGLNDPFLVRYLSYVGNLLRGDMGISYRTGKPVFQMVMSRYPTTITFAVCSTAIMLLVGLPLGILSAVKPYSLLDNVSVAIGMIGISMPAFWLGLILILIFSVRLGWLPSSGYTSWKHMILPALTLGLGNAATLMRMTRSSMLECIRQDYVKTARAKGQTNSAVILHHVFRNALIPIMTVVGMTFAGTLGGSAVLETVFTIRGLGKLTIDSINSRDYPVVLGAILIISFTTGVINLVIDILYAVVDPRIKSTFAKSKKKQRGSVL